MWVRFLTVIDVLENAGLCLGFVVVHRLINVGISQRHFLEPLSQGWVIMVPYLEVDGSLSRGEVGCMVRELMRKGVGFGSVRLERGKEGIRENRENILAHCQTRYTPETVCSFSHSRTSICWDSYGPRFLPQGSLMECLKATKGE